MNPTDSSLDQTKAHINFANFMVILFAIVLLLGLSYLKKPELFSFANQETIASNINVPVYYPYVTPDEFTQPEVLGADTLPDGPMIINEDGSVTPALTAEDLQSPKVLGASTENVNIPLDQISVNAVPDSEAAVSQYFSDSQKLESGFINNTDFENALMSGNQKLIDLQAEKFIVISQKLSLMPVPKSLEKLQKLKIAQYVAATGLLKNFTQAETNPEIVGEYLDIFLKAQTDLDAEHISMQQKYQFSIPYSPEGALEEAQMQILEGSETQAVPIFDSANLEPIR